LFNKEKSSTYVLELIP